MISAIVPTLHGSARLARNLPSVIASLERTGEGWEIVVVDDGGGDLGPLPEGVRVVTLPENRGYGPAVNAGARAAGGDYLLVLNDDVRLEASCVRVLRRHFPDPRLFAVVPAVRSPLAACGDEGGKTAEWTAGLLEIREAQAPADGAHPTLYPVGCCYLCGREGYRSLGGYHDVFAPFLWEDVDLGYRAWRRGLTVLHDPRAACDHEGSATLKEQRTLAERERVSFRNRVLFHLRNVRDPARRAESFGAWAAFALFEAIPERRQGLVEALERYDSAVRDAVAGLSDEDILERVRSR
jgi:GT2 family glycosyltransferase